MVTPEDYYCEVLITCEAAVNACLQTLGHNNCDVICSVPIGFSASQWQRTKSEVVSFNRYFESFLTQIVTDMHCAFSCISTRMTRCMTWCFIPQFCTVKLYWVGDSLG